MPNFEVFKKRMVPYAKQPYVTLQKRGILSFNKSAYAALGSPEAVELLYDRDSRVIGVRPIDARAEHAYPIRSALTKSGSSYLVSGTAFVQYYGIPAETSIRYAAFKDGDVLCMDLNGEGTEVSAARGRDDENGDDVNE